MHRIRYGALTAQLGAQHTHTLGGLVVRVKTVQHLVYPVYPIKIHVYIILLGTHRFLIELSLLGAWG
jgi:hypothetical protein